MLLAPRPESLMSPLDQFFAGAAPSPDLLPQGEGASGGDLLPEGVLLPEGDLREGEGASCARETCCEKEIYYEPVRVNDRMGEV